MNRTPVVSSNLVSVGFEKNPYGFAPNEVKGTLEVEFKNGDVYDYLDVPQERYQALLNAASVGSYFATYIKPAFRCLKISKEAAEQAVSVGAIKAEPATITGRKDNYEPSPEYDGINAFMVLLADLKSNKPNDQSQKDRQYAITITELEKVFAYYFTYVVNKL